MTRKPGRDFAGDITALILEKLEQDRPRIFSFMDVDQTKHVKSPRG